MRAQLQLGQMSGQIKAIRNKNVEQQNYNGHIAFLAYKAAALVASAKRQSPPDGAVKKAEQAVTILVNAANQSIQTPLSASAVPWTPPSAQVTAKAPAPKVAPQAQQQSQSASGSEEPFDDALPTSSDRPTLREFPFGVHWMSEFVHVELTRLQSRGMKYVPYPEDVLQFLYPERPGDDVVVAPNMELSDHIPMDKPRTKLFFGHLWIRLPTVVLQWFIHAFTPEIFPKVMLCHVQKHCATRGTSKYWRGCAHITVTGASLELIEKTRKRLHGRFLFDSRGVWIANTGELQHLMREYCKKVRVLPQGQRHAQLQGLPCNVMSCEVPQNEPPSTPQRRGG